MFYRRFRWFPFVQNRIRNFPWLLQGFPAKSLKDVPGRRSQCVIYVIKSGRLILALYETGSSLPFIGLNENMISEYEVLSSLIFTHVTLESGRIYPQFGQEIPQDGHIHCRSTHIAFAVKANACITVYNCAAVVVRFLRKTVVYGLSVHIVT